MATLPINNDPICHICGGYIIYHHEGKPCRENYTYIPSRLEKNKFAGTNPEPLSCPSPDDLELELILEKYDFKIDQNKTILDRRESLKFLNKALQRYYDNHCEKIY